MNNIYKILEKNKEKINDICNCIVCTIESEKIICKDCKDKWSFCELCIIPINCYKTNIIILKNVDVNKKNIHDICICCECFNNYDFNSDIWLIDDY
jgi:hypothetical protein